MRCISYWSASTVMTARTAMMTADTVHCGCTYTMGRRWGGDGGGRCEEGARNGTHRRAHTHTHTCLLSSSRLFSPPPPCLFSSLGPAPYLVNGKGQRPVLLDQTLQQKEVQHQPQAVQNPQRIPEVGRAVVGGEVW